MRTSCWESSPVVCIFPPMKDMQSFLKNSENVRLALQSEFVSRCKKNSAYSMRAYAKFIDVDQSLLSKVLRGERVLSIKNAQTVLLKLGFRLSDLNSADKISRDEYIQLSHDIFAFISDWYHFAILELSKTKKFSTDPARIAKRLGIHVEEARGAIERLQRLGFVEIKNSKWVLLKPNNNWTNNQVTTEARRSLQRSLLQKSIEAIDTISFTERDNGSLTVAVDKNRISEFKEKLAQVRTELGEYFQAKGDFNEVYQLVVAFFPLTKIEGDKNETSNL